MKKIIAAVLMLVMVVSLCACKANHSAKYIGTWADETNNAVLVLAEDGAAVLRVGSEILELGWSAEDYDTIQLTMTVPVDKDGNIIEETEEVVEETETEVDETEEEVEETETEVEDTETEAEETETEAEETETETEETETETETET